MTPTDTITIDYKQALRLLWEVLEEYGRYYVYKPVISDCGTVQCKYSHEGAPSCLIGQVLYRAGVTVRELDLMLDAIGESDLPRRVHLSEGALLLFEKIQAHQDNYIPWGEAVHRAIETVEPHIAESPHLA